MLKCSAKTITAAFAAAIIAPSALGQSPLINNPIHYLDKKTDIRELIQVEIRKQINWKLERQGYTLAPDAKKFVADFLIAKNNSYEISLDASPAYPKGQGMQEASKGITQDRKYDAEWAKHVLKLSARNVAANPKAPRIGMFELTDDIGTAGNSSLLRDIDIASEPVSASRLYQQQKGVAKLIPGAKQAPKP